MDNREVWHEIAEMNTKFEREIGTLVLDNIYMESFEDPIVYFGRWLDCYSLLEGVMLDEPLQ